MAEQEQENTKQEFNSATGGLNLDQSINQVRKGTLTYALNAAVENFDANGISYQNEEGNELCLSFPEGFALIGNHFIGERNKHIFFMTNPETGDSQIGYMDNNDCEYRILINSTCLNFNINFPIHKVEHKINNCGTEIYWTDGYNPRRYLDIDNLPKKLKYGTVLCDPSYMDEIDCNRLKVQPNFSIPIISVVDVVEGGNQLAGTVQFFVQYSDALGNPYTSYYSGTNPTPIADPSITSVNFNYPVGKSVVLDISNLDGTGQFQYFNLAILKTVNAISSPQLVGTYYIDALQKQITYTGQSVDSIRLAIKDIFERFPYYEVAKDLTAVQDILIWDGLTSISRVNYQKIANQITLQWESWRIPATENYADELNATNLRSYLRDEVYPYEIQFLLANGKETDSFHIPGRIKGTSENRPDVLATNPDLIGTPDPVTGASPYWKVYNTASVIGFCPEYSPDTSYKGPYQYGEFAYWESTDIYPCNVDIWGELVGQRIRHHKFPDVLVSPIYESKLFLSPGQMVMGNDAVFPIGVKIDPQQISTLIGLSYLTEAQKDEIIGYKIVRGDRSTNKSIIAKGILRNVGTYTKEEQKFYYPNYPYNDLKSDPFLNVTNNAYSQECVTWEINIYALPNGGPDFVEIEYTSCDTNKTLKNKIYTLGITEWCSITKPIILSPAMATVGYAEYEVWYAMASTLSARGYHVKYDDVILGAQEVWVPGGDSFSRERLEFHVAPNTGGVIQSSGPGVFNAWFYSYHTAQTTCDTSTPMAASNSNPDLAYRQIFNSPDTSFGQPFLGNILKLENVMFGKGLAHFVEVKKNAKYKLITEDAQRLALESAERLAAYTDPFNSTAMFVAYQAYLTIYINGITRRNYAYSFNSIADYNYSAAIPNDLGIKQRPIDIARYLTPGVLSVGDVEPITGDSININNYERESSVFIRTDLDKTALPFPDKTPSLIPGGVSLITDNSRFTISDIGNCGTPGKEQRIEVVSYYASLKNEMINQWGQIYSYETIDTGFQRLIDSTSVSDVVFGGDTFISRFAFKTKLPFFIDNRVNAPDDSDIFYDEIGNIAYPKYWHSARSILKSYTSGAGVLSNIISYKAHNFDCPNDEAPTSTVTTSTTNYAPGSVAKSSTITYYDGYFYLFAYGTPNFYCESSYNTDLRQAFNNMEGDFWPHVSTGIPDDWVQESFVSIANDNTYYYNTTFSKQNKENTFTHLPIDWDKPCRTNYPFRAIYSDGQNTDADNRVNGWLTYRAGSYFDFPQNYGKLTSLDGIQNREILARFENKSLLYNHLLTIDTSNPQAAYVGNPNMFKNPPVDFAETDLGYVGSQHKVLLKLPQGQLTVDAKRGQVFIIGQDGYRRPKVDDLCALGSGMNRFFTDHLAFEILRHFPEVDVDNNFTGVGLHAVYDSKYDRIILTKLDYIPITKDVKYDEITKEYYVERVVNNVVISNSVLLTDSDYFCNKSWTLSYNINTKSWISFHSYIPNWYIAENNYFYSGINGCCEEIDFIVGTMIDIPTTTTTTTYVCSLDFGIVTITSTTTTLPISLELTFFDNNVPVNDINSLSDWNAFFNLPIFGMPFTSIVVIGNTVFLSGGSNITLFLGIFSNATFPERLMGDPNTLEPSYLLSIKDPSGIVIGLDEASFRYNPGQDGIHSKLNEVFLPAVSSAGDQSFMNNEALTVLSMPALETIGDFCFYSCSGMTTFDLPNLITAGISGLSLCSSVPTFYFPKLITAGAQCFYMDYSATCIAINLPLAQSIGDYCFAGNTQVETIFLPSCLTLGSTTGNEGVFFYMDNLPLRNITLTVPIALTTCNAGAPDGDIGTIDSSAGLVSGIYWTYWNSGIPSGYSVTIITV